MALSLRENKEYVIDANFQSLTYSWTTKLPEVYIGLADFPAVFFHISHWYLSWNTIDKSKSQDSVE